MSRAAAGDAHEALSWLPADTESLWVNQAPFLIDDETSASLLFRRATRLYCLDRMMALNGGGFYRNLAGQTVSDGVWEISVSSKPEAAGMATLALMAMVGFIVFI